jgi:PAS domain S-box-containing protein
VTPTPPNGFSPGAFAVAAATIAVAAIVRVSLTPLMGQSFPLATTFSAVAFVVWYGGWAPALLTAVGGFVVMDLLMIPGNSFTRPPVAELVSISVYLASCVAIILLGETTRHAQRRLEAGRQELASANLALETKVEAQSLLAAIVASSEDAIISKTLEGRITSWNKGAERLFGYSAHEAIGQSIMMLIPPDQRDQELTILDHIRKGERVDHLEVVRVTKSGERRDISVTVSPVHDRHGHIIGASKTARDITERKAAAEKLQRSEDDRASADMKLRESHDVLALAMRAGRMGAWSRDLTLDTVWWSPELATLFGLSPDDQDFSRFRLFDLVSPEDQERLPVAIQEAVANRVDYTLQFRFRHASTREWRWMEVRGKATYDEAGQPRMLHGLGIDITEQRRAVEALQEADRRKDDFLATLAHELRNPLAPITSGLHIMRTAGDDHAIAGQAREIMERQVAQMIRLVDDLLDVARITTGKVEMRLAPLDLAAAISDAVETTSPVITAGGQRLELTMPDEPIYVHADRTRLAQVFSNLLNNSARYSEPGQVIRLTVAREGGMAAVRVRDEGVGIHADMLPRVFEMFRQADRTGGRSRGGLGIGLFIVRRIVEMHGGTVDATSPGLGQGAEFMVRIPTREPVAAAAPAAPANSESTPQARRRVLIVDDNADAADSLGVLLSIYGHDTKVANDGETALVAAASFRPDVVFLDIGMPNLDGHETARRLRAQPGGESLVIVALTGWGQAEDRRRSKEAGFDHHLVKPADPAALSKLIASI